MSLYVVRAGSHGEQEAFALENNIVTIGWNELPDLSQVKTREELYKVYSTEFPDAKKHATANYVGQIWKFIHDIQIGDLVALPLKSQSAIAIGKIESQYTYQEMRFDIRHIRVVKWLKTIPRSSFDQDILYTFGAFMAVFKVERNNAESRVRGVLNLKDDPSIPKGRVTPPDDDLEESVDIEELANDQIVKFIEANFKGHNLPRLVECILKAQGYVTRVSPPGPDGGVDLLAASGSLGFDHPRICVQVKSTNSPIDVTVVRELQGVMSRNRADQGLLVSWGGFTSSALKEANEAFFTLRLWDQGGLIREVTRNYDRFDDEMKAELPLKKIWVLVMEDL